MATSVALGAFCTPGGQTSLLEVTRTQPYQHRDDGAWFGPSSSSWALFGPIILALAPSRWDSVTCYIPGPALVPSGIRRQSCVAKVLFSALAALCCFSVCPLLWLLVLTPPLFIPCQQACEIMSAFGQALSLKAAR